MITAIALYEGKTLGDFELVCLSTNAELIDKIIDLISDIEPQLLPLEDLRRERRQRLHMVDSEKGDR